MIGWGADRVCRSLCVHRDRKDQGGTGSGTHERVPNRCKQLLLEALCHQLLVILFVVTMCSLSLLLYSFPLCNQCLTERSQQHIALAYQLTPSCWQFWVLVEWTNSLGLTISLIIRIVFLVKASDYSIQVDGAYVDYRKDSQIPSSPITLCSCCCLLIVSRDLFLCLKFPWIHPCDPCETNSRHRFIVLAWRDFDQGMRTS